MLVHGDKLRWLAWLRVTMLLRNFRRRPAILIVTIIGLLVLIFAGGVGILGLITAIQVLPAPANTEILYPLFSGLLLFWILLPLLAYSTNEGLDVTKLQLFPLTRPELMFSLLFSSLFDIWTVFLFLIFGGIIVAWWLHSLALGLLTLLTLIIFYIVIVSISQLVTALLMRTLQSRRFRDLSVIIIALFGSSCYIISRLVTNLGNSQNIGAMLSNGTFSQYLQWLPSGVAAGAIRAADQNNWGGSFALLGILVLIAVLALYLWQLVLERSMTASESGAARRSKQLKQGTPKLATRPSAAAATTAIAGSPSAAVATSATPARVQTLAGHTTFFDQLLALVRKEIICFWRDPLLKVRMLQPLIYVVVFIALPAVNSSSRGGASERFYASYTPFVSVAIVFLFILTLSQNTLGIERQSLTSLFLFPIDRRRLLWGKNLAIFLLSFIILVVLMASCVILSRESGMVPPALVIALSGIGVALGWGNLASCYFPRFQPQIGKRGYQATGGQAQAGGCMNQLMSLVMTLVTVISLAPVALAIGIPFFLNMSWLLAITVPLSLIYGLAFYVILTNLSARRMLATEPEILAVITRE